MTGLEALLGIMGGDDECSMKPISVADLDKGFEPIADLKPGDKVRAKGNRYCADKTAKNGTVFIVNRVGNFKQQGGGSDVYNNDFTALFDDGSDLAAIHEFAFDSRRFERVTE